MIMGTSTCHMVLARDEQDGPRACAAIVQDGIIPGLLRLRGRPVVRRRPLRAGSSSTPCRRPITRRPASAASTSTRCSRTRPPVSRVGESGLLALDWWNGNRSVLVDAEVSGLLIGATLATAPEEIYRALIEATAYRDARDHRDVRGPRRPDPRHRRLRRPGREEPADHADLRRRDRAPVPHQRLGPDAGPRLGHVRGGRGRRRRRRARDDRGRRRARWPGCETTVYLPIPADATSTTCSTASTSGCTTTSGVARTTSWRDALAAHRARRARRLRRSGGLMMPRRDPGRARPAPRGAAAPRPGRLDRRQRQRARPGDAGWSRSSRRASATRT